MTDLYEKALDRSEANYLRGIRSAIYGLWAGTIDFPNFVTIMVDLIDVGYRRAWLQGMSDFGLGPEDMTADEERALQFDIGNETTYIYDLGTAIQTADKLSGGKLAPFYARAEMWANRFEAIRSEARMMAGEDEKLEWVMGPTKEHCSDCLRANGKVYRASVWASTGLQPRSRDLECRGYKCLCELVPTDAPLSRGRPLIGVV